MWTTTVTLVFLVPVANCIIHMNKAFVNRQYQWHIMANETPCSNAEDWVHAVRSAIEEYNRKLAVSAHTYFLPLLSILLINVSPSCYFTSIIYQWHIMANETPCSNATINVSGCSEQCANGTRDPIKATVHTSCIQSLVPTSIHPCTPRE